MQVAYICLLTPGRNTASTIVIEQTGIAGTIIFSAATTGTVAGAEIGSGVTTGTIVVVIGSGTTGTVTGATTGSGLEVPPPQLASSPTRISSMTIFIIVPIN
jgi:hypothetical protein